MYKFTFILHTINGDKMNIDIREKKKKKIKNDDEKTIIETINESVITDDELVLPGLGVMIELFWNDLDDNTKMNIANIIKNKVKNS